MKLRILLALVIPVASLVLAGCSNVGDTNPVSPDQMEQFRKQQAEQRSGYKPSTDAPNKR